MPDDKKALARLGGMSLAAKVRQVSNLIGKRRKGIEEELQEWVGAEDVVNEVISNFSSLLDELDESLDTVRDTITGLKKFIRERRKELEHEAEEEVEPVPA